MAKRNKFRNFALKQTLEKMSERINITNSNFDADLGSTGVPTEEKLQEFALGK